MSFARHICRMLTHFKRLCLGLMRTLALPHDQGEVRQDMIPAVASNQPAAPGPSAVTRRKTTVPTLPASAGSWRLSFAVQYHERRFLSLLLYSLVQPGQIPCSCALSAAGCCLVPDSTEPPAPKRMQNKWSPPKTTPDGDTRIRWDDELAGQLKRWLVEPVEWFAQPVALPEMCRRAVSIHPVAAQPLPSIHVAAPWTTLHQQPAASIVPLVQLIS